MKNLKKYILPGIIFQSVVMAGGYGTGAEIAAYFFPGGGLGGLLGLVFVVPVIWGTVTAAVFEIERRRKVFDYASLSKVILKKGWRLYELGYFMFLLLVLGVAISSFGNITGSIFGMPPGLASLLGAGIMGLMAVLGQSAIEKVFSRWSVFLMAAYTVFFIASASAFGIKMPEDVLSPWLFSSARYAFYNLGSLPSVLFAAKNAETRREAVISGLVCGVMGVLPAVLIYFPMLSFYPGICGAAVPVERILSALDMPWLKIAVYIALLGTLTETGTGMIFSVCRRFSPAENRLTDILVSAGLLLCGYALSLGGMEELIKTGYGAMSWIFMAIFIVPVAFYWGKKLFLRLKCVIKRENRPCSSEETKV